MEGYAREGWWVCGGGGMGEEAISVVLYGGRKTRGAGQEGRTMAKQWVGPARPPNGACGELGWLCALGP